LRRESFETPRELWLDLRLPSGQIVLESADGAETIVELEARGNGADAQEVIDAARIELRPRGAGDEIVVDVQRKRSRFFEFSRGEIVLRVTAPHGANVEVSTASADIEGRGRFGALKAQAASGDIRFGEAAGRVDVKRASGDVEIAHVGGDSSINTASGDIRIGLAEGDATIRSASGDVEVDEAAGSVTVQTASGDQRLSSVRSGRVVLQSASGDQTVGVRRGTRVRLDAKTLSGDTRSELDAGDESKATGDVLELRATALSGDIRILRA
jgi:DUF4097 and DUF4098 domain-containing protein YvlB